MSGRREDLSEPELIAAYRESFAEWIESEDAALRDSTSGDGLG